MSHLGDTSEVRHDALPISCLTSDVNVTDINLFTGKSRTTHRWVDISNVGDDYWEDLSSDCQDYVMSLDKYKNMDYDTMIDDYNKPIEKIHDDALKYFKDQIKKREVV